MEPTSPVPNRGRQEKLRVAWIVEETIGFYRKHFVPLVIVFLIANLSTWGIQYYYGTATESLLSKSNISMAEILEDPEAAYQTVVPVLLDLFLLGLATAAILFAVVLALHALIIQYTYDQLVARQANWHEVLSKVLPRFLPLIFATLVSGLIVVLGLVALLVPGIVLAIMFILVPHSILIEGRGPIASLSRSSSLTAGNKWTILFFLAFWLIVSVLLSMVVRQIAPAIWQDAVQLIEGTLFGPILPISTTIIYVRLATSEVPA